MNNFASSRLSFKFSNYDCAYTNVSNELSRVLLGSFSNYLVTKSSVPVMVARKRLRKHSKFKRANLRLSNVLLTPQRSLASAKVDWCMHSVHDAIGANHALCVIQKRSQFFSTRNCFCVPCISDQVIANLQTAILHHEFKSKAIIACTLPDLSPRIG